MKGNRVAQECKDANSTLQAMNAALPKFSAPLAWRTCANRIDDITIFIPLPHNARLTSRTTRQYVPDFVGDSPLSQPLSNKPAAKDPNPVSRTWYFTLNLQTCEGNVASQLLAFE
jgi:hypothetical protein